jgi:prepilin-type N-terminal cleavage/methylation domain-containing protein
MRRKDSAEKGFSLIEVIFAVGLFSFCLLATMRIAAEVSRSHQTARDYTSALALARNKIEEMKTTPYKELTDSENLQIDLDEVDGTGIFDRRVRVTDQLNPLCKVVQVSVSWGEAVPMKIVLGSIIAP